VTQPRGDVPTGTLTYLFTDIEGSTRLANQLGAGFRDQLDEHDRILQDAISANMGAVSSTAGDSFFVRFTNAISAVRAAVAAQRALNTHAWAGEPFRARMGLHTAEASDEDEAYPEIARAARIMAAAHGGQVLLSNSTRELIWAHLPDGVRVRTLGAYRLKDIPEPELLHQLEVSGLPSAFPPPRALDVRRAHLPPEATAFFGRSHELTEIAQLLADRRLVTLTGPGGTGKTRIALRTAAAVAERFADGAFFVSLAATTDASMLPAVIASAIGLPEELNRSVGQVLSEWLRERDVLLLLDNLEQLEAAAASEVDRLLAGAARLRVLATSRAPLHVAGEQEFPVPPFAIPPAGADEGTLASSEAVALFVDRARLVRTDFDPDPDDFPVIADIARSLDGLPLAIELAAARTRLLSVRALRDRLAHRLDALATGPATVEPRQQSLRAAIAWSHDLLPEADRAVFRRLAAFVGGWTYEAADAVAGGPAAGPVDAALERLVEQSLIQAAPMSDLPRFAMLATIGEFASEQLASSDETPEVHRRHAAFFRAFAERARGESDGPRAGAWFDRIEADLDNLRAAIDRAPANGDLKTALAIAAALGPFWLQRNHSAEGQRILVNLVRRARSDEGPEVAAAAAAAGFNATWLGDYATGREMGELSVRAYRRLGDDRGLAFASGVRGFSMIETDPRAALGMIEFYLALARQLGDVRLQGQALLATATAQVVLGRLAEARTSLVQSIDLARQSNDWYFALFSSIFLGRLKLLTGEINEGIADYRTVIETARALDLRVGIAIALEYFGEVALWAGDTARAVRLGAAAARIKEELGGGIPPRIGGALEPLVVGRERLPPDAFDREVAAGRNMDLEASIAEALSTPVPTSVPSR
jgi:predicted ATPase/class 3 adenylate cyclase